MLCFLKTTLLLKVEQLFVINLDDFLSLGDVFFCHESVTDGDAAAKNMAENILAEALASAADELDIKLSDTDDVDDFNKSEILRKVFRDSYDDNFEKVLSGCTGNEETITVMNNPDYDVYYFEKSGGETEAPDRSRFIDEISAKLKGATEAEIAKHEKMLEDVSTFINSYKKPYDAATTQTARNKIVQEIKLILNRDYRSIAADFTKDIIHGILSGTY